MVLTNEERKKKMLHDVKSWYEDAMRDLMKANKCIKLGWNSDSCFYSQQAAEKIIKAFLRSKGIIARGHKLESLLKRSEAYGLEASDILEDARRLSDQYIAPRYPNFREERGIKLENYTEDFANYCLRTAKMIWERVLSQIKSVITE